MSSIEEISSACRRHPNFIGALIHHRRVGLFEVFEVVSPLQYLNQAVHALAMTANGIRLGNGWYGVRDSTWNRRSFIKEQLRPNSRNPSLRLFQKRIVEIRYLFITASVAGKFPAQDTYKTL
jgi:hypothetical protein